VAGEFSARVTIVDRQFAPGSRWGKHGIMARQDCHPMSRYSFMHDHGEDLQDVTRFATRPSHRGAGNFELVGPLPGASHYDTLRLDRCGNEFIGYVFDDQGLVGPAGEWVRVGSYNWGPDAPESVFLGLAVTSHQGCNVTTITFEDWEVLPFCEGPVENLVCEENAEGGLDLTWTHHAGADLSQPIRVRVNGEVVLTVPGDSTAATIPPDELPSGQISTIGVINASGVAANCTYPVGITAEGFITNWLLLGPYVQPPPTFLHASPGVDAIRADHLRNADGSINEIDVEPRAGDTVMTDYGATARSIALASGVGAATGINQNGTVPTWAARRDPDDTINFNDYYGGDVNNIMMHALTYLVVEEDTVVDIGLASDDSVQVLLDGVEIHINNVARGAGGANTIQDVVLSSAVPELNPLTKGTHRLMVKVFEGGGAHGFRLRFQDPFSGLPVLAGRIRLSPTAAPPLEVCDNDIDDDGDGMADCTDSDCAKAANCLGTRFVRGDPNASGSVDLTDGIVVLNYLFLGGVDPACFDAADTDDNGGLVISDAVIIFSWLFQGGMEPRPPSPDTGAYSRDRCGLDPTDDGLDCASFPPCA
jgi:hypothetical protein